MSERSQVNASHLSVGGLLGILFVGLKLTGYIDWSWWWVTAPFWAPPVIVLGILGAIVGSLALASAASFFLNSRRRK